MENTLNMISWEKLFVRVFRIVPTGTEGNLMIDGEKVPYGKLDEGKHSCRKIDFYS